MSLRKVLTPVNAVFGAFAGMGNSADMRVIKYQNSEFAGELNRAKVTGEDLANTSWGRFVAQSVLTIPDRFMSLGKEFARLPMACNILAWSPADYLEFLQFFVRLMFVFLFFKMVGRGSQTALVGPDSLFWQTDAPVDTNTSRAEKVKSATEWAAPVAAMLQ